MTIDFIPIGMPWYRLPLSWVKTLLLCCMGKPRKFAKLQINQRKELFDSFVHKNMSLTRRTRKYTNEIVKQYGFEAVITGSDQVWRPMYNAHLQDMFLRFVKNPNIKKIAYAASFGVDNWEFTHRQTEECGNLAKKIDAISVRENSGIVLCKNHLSVDAVEVLDPTLLHTAEDYEKLCAGIPKATEPYLASYVLDITPEKQQFIEEIAKQQGLPVRIFSCGNNAEFSIEQWLAIYRDAKYIITDSFHGTVFSILFQKPFLSIVNEGRGASRFYSLMSKFGFESRLITSTNQTIVSNDINWKEVDAKLESLRDNATKFLTQALKS